MKLNDLKPKEGSTFKRKCLGRGIGSGKGKTAGKGHKGQKARTGVAVKGFEGGQMPLYRRMPKRGFTNVSGKKMVSVTLGRLQMAIDAKQIDAKKPVNEDVLVAAGVVRRKKDGIKLISTGALNTKLDLTLTAATQSAAEAVKKAGGSFTALPQKPEPVSGEKLKKKSK